MPAPTQLLPTLLRTCSRNVRANALVTDKQHGELHVDTSVEAETHPRAAIQDTVQADGTSLCALASNKEVDMVDPPAAHANPLVGACADSGLPLVSAAIDEAVNATEQLQREPRGQDVDRLVCVDRCYPPKLLSRPSVLEKLNCFTDDTDALDTVPALALFAIFVMASAEMKALQCARTRGAIEAAVEVVEPARCQQRAALMAMKPCELKEFYDFCVWHERALSCHSESPHASVVAAASSRDRLVELILEVEVGRCASAKTLRNAGA
jgi:hypothetical protein